MVNTISAKDLSTLLQGKSRFALIDVREAGEYNSSHIADSSLIPRRELEFRMDVSAPVKGEQLVICDDDGRRAALAAATLAHMGYSNVSVLDRGINQWSTEGYPTEWGSNVISKDFGERMEVEHHVPEIEATELHERIERGDKLVILDTRTPEEYQRFCIPGGRSVPGGELALRVTDITKDLDEDTTIIINCAGRTRSVIGTRVLQRMGLTNIYGLKNGTSGWLLAGYELETGGDRLDLPEPSSQGLAAAEDYAARLAEEDGVRYLDVVTVQSMLDEREQRTCYFVDVRTAEEYAAGHIPGFRWFPGGQVVQRSDDVLVVKNCPVIFCCDGRARATFIASWYRQFGFEEVYAVDGGTTAWASSGRPLETGSGEASPAGLEEARGQVKLLSPQELDADLPASIIFVETSSDFSNGHVPGARWAPRGSLELQISDIAPDKAASIAVTCNNGQNAAFAGAALKGLGYRNVSVLEGGMAAWRQAGLAVEQGLSGVMRPPTDVVVSGPERNFADMMHYLRWETALGEKYAVD
ncbi:MAG: rhodanese-related sulfurtransferase [Chloroflexi bacterium]|nr:rhodanese-related sulfurtransferase [Chloroflexota bacterium]